MKKFLTITLLLIPILCFAQDKVSVQIRYEKYLYTCSKGHELITNSNKQKWECPVCKETMGEGQHKDLGDTIYFGYDEYQTIKQEDIDKVIKERVDRRIYDIKNPPPYIEPTLTDLKNMRLDHLKEVDRLTHEVAIQAPAEIIVMKAEMVNRATSLQERITMTEPIRIR